MITQNITRHGSSRNRLMWALFLGGLYLMVVAIGSYFSGSLSLLAAASHMMLHNGALLIGIAATTLAMKAPNEKFSAGYNKVEAIGGYTNGILLLVVAGWIIWQALGLGHKHEQGHHEINATLAGFVALFGLILHFISAYILYKGKEENLCVNAAFYHIFFDVLGTFSALAMGVFVVYTGFHEADLFVAGLIGLLILFNGVRIMRNSLRLLMDETPANLNYKEVVKTLKTVPHIEDVHNLVIRRRDSKTLELSAHLILHKNCVNAHHWNDCRKQAADLLMKKFGVSYCVLQLEASEECEHCAH